jgi:hypothetical protein
VDKHALLSPKEIARSIGELFSQSGQWLLWLLTVVITGAVGIAERFSIHDISNHTWFRVALVGAIISVVVAFHRTRLERDQARAGDIPDDHLEELQRRLNMLQGNVDQLSVCDYGDTPHGRRTLFDAFRAHYPTLTASCDAWDQAVGRVEAARQALLDDLSDELDQQDFDPPEYDVRAILELLHKAIVKRAEDGRLGEPKSVLTPWTTTPSLPPPPGDPQPATWVLSLGHRAVAAVPALPVDGPLGSRNDRLEAAQQRIETIWKTAELWDSAAEIAASKEALTRLQQPLEDDLREWRRASRVRVSRKCPICRKNEGWREPQ